MGLQEDANRSTEVYRWLQQAVPRDVGAVLLLPLASRGTRADREAHPGRLRCLEQLGRDAARVVLDYGVTPSFYVADGAWSGAGEVGTCAYNVSKPIAKCVGAVFFGIYGTIGISVYYMGFGTYKVLSCLGGTLVKPIVHGSGEGL